MKRKTSLNDAIISRLCEGTEKITESYDMYNVVEDLMRNVEKLKSKIDDGEMTDAKEISKSLDSILKRAQEDIQDAW